MQFDTPDIYESIREQADAGKLDDLAFGVIGFDEDGGVTSYNAHESEFASLAREQVMGKDLFIEVAPCMNNFMISERFDEEEDIDSIIDYVLTAKMRPTKVRLRLLQSQNHEERFILVERH